MKKVFVFLVLAVLTLGTSGFKKSCDLEVLQEDCLALGDEAYDTVMEQTNGNYSLASHISNIIYTDFVEDGGSPGDGEVTLTLQ
jgi:hypothetical protein